MIETKSKTINGRNWTVTQFTGTKSLKAFHIVFNTLGPAVGQLAGSVAALRQAMKTGVAAKADTGSAITLLLDRMGDTPTLEANLLWLLSSAAVDGTPVNRAVFDDVFTGPGILALPEVLKFVVETNYGDFTGPLKSFIARLDSEEQADAAPSAG